MAQHMKAYFLLLFLFLIPVFHATAIRFIHDLDPYARHSLSTLTHLSGTLSLSEFERFITINKTLALSTLAYVNVSESHSRFFALVQQLAYSEFSCPFLDEEIFKNVPERVLRMYMGFALQAPASVSTCIVSLVENSLRGRMNWTPSSLVDPWPALALFQVNFTALSNASASVSVSDDPFIQLLLAYSRPSIRRLYYQYLPFRTWTRLDKKSQMHVFFEARGTHHDHLYERMTSVHIASIFDALAKSSTFTRESLLYPFVRHVVSMSNASSPLHTIPLGAIGSRVAVPHEKGSAIDMYTPAVIALLWYEPDLVVALERLHSYFAPLSKERFDTFKDQDVRVKAFLGPHILDSSVYDTMPSAELLSLFAFMALGKWKGALVRFVSERLTMAQPALQATLLASDCLSPFDAHMKLDPMYGMGSSSAGSHASLIHEILTIVEPLLCHPSAEEISRRYDSVTLFLNYWRLKDYRSFYQQMSSEELQAQIYQLRKSDLLLLQYLTETLLANNITIGHDGNRSNAGTLHAAATDLSTWFGANKNLNSLSPGEASIVEKFNSIVASNPHGSANSSLQGAASCRPLMNPLLSLAIFFWLVTEWIF